MLGNILYPYFGIDKLKDNKEYHVWCNIYYKFNNYIAPILNQLLTIIYFHISGDETITQHMTDKKVEHKEKRIDYKQLKYRERLRWVQNLAEKVVVVYGDMNCLREGIYLHVQAHITLATDVTTVQIKVCNQKEFMVNFGNLCDKTSYHQLDNNVDP